METATPKPFIVSAKDEDIVKAVYQYRFVTSLDVAHLIFRPSYLPYVRGRLSRLAGGKDLTTGAFLFRFQLPSTVGNKERVFTLGSRGRAFLQEHMGQAVDWHFQPNKVKFVSFSGIYHHLLLTRFLVACEYWSRTSHYTITALRLSYELAKNPPRVPLLEKSKKTVLTVIPDAWVLFESKEAKAAVLLELDRGMEHGAQFKQHVRSRIELIRSGEYQRVFGVPGVIVMYITTGQTPEYRHTRCRAMNAWTQEVLQALGLRSWAGIFRFTAVEFDTLYDSAASLFEAPVWLRPDTPESVGLFDLKPKCLLTADRHSLMCFQAAHM